ncbi:DUF427-domain-containing protein [Boletus edulis]|uniref:DUF427-domain-containing protein n=1 Tax=Boletus edulis BED1 TaxID=1328754 RepID=A0AAD4BW90_BOLED|nr:DUF427-domain-containing protein [Boletus edulis]KAF8427978.1 DUF427-domain-containing protein [Boletus edulis BED1]KAF8440872.1 DUF427-domain-containing protein [Boletus edulis BED1]
MVKVLLNNVVLADSPSPVILEGNYYFPPDSVSKANLKNSGTTTVCPWKGTASYYSADVNGKAVKDVAWYYPDPSAKGANIKNHVAFYKTKVVIED